MLETLFTAGLLFAERSSVQRLPAPVASWSAPLLFGIGLTALVSMALIVALVQLWQRRRGHNPFNSPHELWSELCRVHQLDKTDCAALRELAEVRTVEPAAAIFVRADLWQLEADSVEVQHLRPQLQRLQKLLFGGSLPSPKSVKL